MLPVDRYQTTAFPGQGRQGPFAMSFAAASAMSLSPPPLTRLSLRHCLAPSWHDKGHLPKGRRTLGRMTFGAESRRCGTS